MAETLAADAGGEMNQPLLLVVTGRPGTGKTTLAHALAREIRCPCLCRDEFKEGRVNTAGSDHVALGKDANWEVYETFFQAIELLLRRGITLVAEAAFQHKLWAPKLESLQTLCRLGIVVCEVAPQTARTRFIERGLADPHRERFHGDHAVQAAREGVDLPVGAYDPPHLAVPTLIVDTTDGYRPDVASIVAFARQTGEATR
jgi:predicted kinase